MIFFCFFISSVLEYLTFSKNFREAFHFSEEKRVHTSSSGNATSTTVQMHREFSSHVEQLVTINSGSGNAPPLPPKKRHVKEYMAAVGQYSQPSELEVELFRKTMEAYYLKAAQWQTHSEDQFSSRTNSYLAAPPPILPPKRGRSSISSTSALALPETSCASATTRLPEGDTPPSTPSRPIAAIKGPPVTNGVDKSDPESNEDGMEQIDLSADLVLKQPDDDGPEVRGGGLDALITHAAKLNKDDYQYQTAFLATYRTFITPLDLTRKLIHRYAFLFRYQFLLSQLYLKIRLN